MVNLTRDLKSEGQDVGPPVQESSTLDSTEPFSMWPPGKVKSKNNKQTKTSKVSTQLKTIRKKIVTRRD